MDPIIVYVVLGLAAVAVGWWVVTGRQRELPARDEPPALRPAPARGTDDDDVHTDPGGAEAIDPVTEPREALPLPERTTVRLEPDPTTGRPHAVPMMPRERPVGTPRPEPLAARGLDDRDRYQKGLAKTRGGFVAKLARIFRGKPKVDDDLRDEVEEVLFTADIGGATATKLMQRVTEVLDRTQVADADAVWTVIRSACLDLLQQRGAPPKYDPDHGVVPKPYVMLAIGVNGVGKTTTLGKLAARHQAAGRKVLLVAGDTFRAAAVEQLDVWARRVGCDLHRGKDKADPSSVIFDGISRGRREGYDVVLCDTAGRLHTRTELMDELAKVGRAATKALARGREDQVTGPHDIFLVLDATIGQNALAQAKMFKETMDFTGLVVTKLDGTAKGGVVLGICDEMEIPIRFIGIGEGVDDLREFDPEAFADALLARDEAGEAVA